MIFGNSLKIVDFDRKNLHSTEANAWLTNEKTTDP